MADNGSKNYHRKNDGYVMIGSANFLTYHPPHHWLVEDWILAMRMRYQDLSTEEVISMLEDLQKAYVAEPAECSKRPISSVIMALA